MEAMSTTELLPQSGRQCKFIQVLSDWAATSHSNCMSFLAVQDSNIMQHVPWGGGGGASGTVSQAVSQSDVPAWQTDRTEDQHRVLSLKMWCLRIALQPLAECTMLTLSFVMQLDDRQPCFSCKRTLLSAWISSLQQLSPVGLVA